MVFFFCFAFLWVGEWVGPINVHLLDLSGLHNFLFSIITHIFLSYFCGKREGSGGGGARVGFLTLRTGAECWGPCVTAYIALVAYRSW